MATRRILAELADVYERQVGQPVVVESTGGVDATRRVQAGEAFDFVVLAGDAIGALEEAGRIDPKTRVDFARSGIAVAVKAGAARPDVSTEHAVCDAVLKARSVGYSTGPSGAHLSRLFERWSIADAIAARIVRAPPGVPVGTLIARGDVELGFQQQSELIDIPEVDVVGLLPSEIQVITVFSAAICRTSTRDGAAKAFLAFLVSSQADAAKRRHGMESAHGRSGPVAIPSHSSASTNQPTRVPPDIGE